MNISIFNQGANFDYSVDARMVRLTILGKVRAAYPEAIVVVTGDYAPEDIYVDFTSSRCSDVIQKVQSLIFEAYADIDAAYADELI